MTPHNRTIAVIWTVVVGTLGYDLYTLLKDGSDTTISAVIIETSKDWLIIPVVFGVLIGHLFFQMGKK